MKYYFIVYYSKKESCQGEISKYFFTMLFFLIRRFALYFQIIFNNLLYMCKIYSFMIRYFIYG